LIVGSKEAAEDVLQEVFTSVWRFRESFNPEKAKLTTWLHRITLNECVKHHRKNITDVDLEGLDFPENANHQPEEILITKCEYEQFQKALASIDKKHRTVLVLRYFNDLSYLEIAEVLSIPLGTVKSRLNQAVTSLREYVTLERAMV
jgi:RNA polymerase sigma-70 factor (ECF subfamily)